MLYRGLDIAENFAPDYLCDAECMSIIQDGEFDWAVLSDILEHLPQPLLSLKSNCRVSRRVIAVVPNWYRLEIFTLLPHHPSNRHIRRLRPRDWIALFEESGLRITHLQGFYYVPSIAFYPLKPLNKIDLMMRNRFTHWLSGLIDYRWSDRPIIRFLGQELIIVAQSTGSEGS